MIGIIDYGMGNLRSVQKGLEAVGAKATILTEAEAARDVGKLVLPGVGAFADGMAHLRRQGWDRVIKTHIAQGRALLGICLGLQLLFEGSQEDATLPDEWVPGLGILPGQVVRFDEKRGQGNGGERLKVPHMGWNTLNFAKKKDPLFAGLEDGCWVYFVHSYYAAVHGRSDGDTSDGVTIATSDYGGSFTAAVRQGNVWATQFHPEKSQAVGLTILKNFAQLQAE